MDGLQEVKLYMRNLRRIIKDLLLHLGFQDGSWVKLNLTCEPLHGPFRAYCILEWARSTHWIHCSTSAVTLLNIHEKQKFKKGAFRLHFQCRRVLLHYSVPVTGNSQFHLPCARSSSFSSVHHPFIIWHPSALASASGISAIWRVRSFPKLRVFNIIEL